MVSKFDHQNDTAPDARSMRSTLLMLLVVGLLLIGLCVASVIEKWRENEAQGKADRAMRVLYLQSQVLSVCEDMNLASRGYALSKESSFLDRYRHAEAHLTELTKTLEELIASNPSQEELSERLNFATGELEKTSDAVTLIGTRAQVLAQKHAMDALRGIITALVENETSLLHQRRSNKSSEDVLLWGAIWLQLLIGLFLILIVMKSLAQYRHETNERISAVESARQEAETARQVAEQALESNTRFLNTVSHEVRTPMVGVIGLAELLSVQDLGSDANKSVRIILDSSERLLQILNSVLDASSLKSGKITLHSKMFPLRSMIGDVKQLVSPEADRKQIDVTGELDGEIPEYVYGDQLRVRQILLNLAFNAVKFTDRGEVKIQARVMQSDAGQVTVRFSVIDTGIGIALEQQSRLFQPFTQLHDSTKSVNGGTGLGLSISKALVELMGGRIGVTSEPGKGSTFWFDIPFRSDESQKL